MASPSRSWHRTESELGFPNERMHRCNMIRGVVQDTPLFIIVLIAYQVSEGATALAVLGSMTSLLSMGVLAGAHHATRGLTEKATNDHLDSGGRSKKDAWASDVTLDDRPPSESDFELRRDNTQSRAALSQTIDPLGRKQPSLVAAPPEAPALTRRHAGPRGSITDHRSVRKEAALARRGATRGARA